MLTSTREASNGNLMRRFSPARLVDGRARPTTPANNAVLSVAAAITPETAEAASTAARASSVAATTALRAWRQRFRAATRDVVAAPAMFTTTLARSMSRGMSESGQRRDAVSCAALRKIGSRKFPPEARSIANRPEGVVDVNALGLAI